MNRILNYKWMFLGALVLAVSACSVVFDPEEGPFPQDAYVKYYGDPGTNRLVDMLVNPNGNVVIVGNQKKSLDAATQDIVILEVDTIGNQINQSTIDVASLLQADSAYATDDYVASIKAVDDGYLIVASFAEVIDGSPQQSNLFWARLDQQLSITQFDTANAGLDNVYGFDITQTSDGNVVVVGQTDRPEENDLTNNPQEQYFMMKFFTPNTDSIMFRKSYGYPGSDDYLIAVTELPDGNIGVIGSTEQSGNGGATGNNVGVLVVNPLATSFVIDEIYGVEINGDLTSDDFPHDVIEVGDAFLVVGTSTRGEQVRPFLIGLRESGAFISSKAIESRWSINATGRGVTLTQENDLIVTGGYPDFLVPQDVLVDNGLANDKNGEVLFMRTGLTGSPKYEFENNFGLVSGNDIGEVVITLPDGSIAIGATIDFGSNQTMMSYMKLNDKGSLLR